MKFDGNHLILQDIDVHAIGVNENRAFRDRDLPYLQGMAKMAITPAVQTDWSRFEGLRSKGVGVEDAFAIFDETGSKGGRVSKVLEFISQIMEAYSGDEGLE